MSRIVDKANALVAAWRGRYGSVPTKQAAISILAVADLETAMGDFPGGAHNWGQVQRGPLNPDERSQIDHGIKPRPRDNHMILSFDTSPVNGRYPVWLWAFDNDVDGADKLLEILLDHRPVIKAGIDTMSPTELAAAMYADGVPGKAYFEGSHDPRQPGGKDANVRDYAAAIARHVAALSPPLANWLPTTGEILPAGPAGPPAPTPPAPPPAPPPPPLPTPTAAAGVPKGPIAVAVAAVVAAVAWWKACG